jgi:hypothetical protein
LSVAATKSWKDDNGEWKKGRSGSRYPRSVRALPIWRHVC